MGKKLVVLTGVALFGSVGCTAVFTDEFEDGTKAQFLTMSNLWSPNVTLVKIDGQEGILAFNGAGSMNQAWTQGAGTAAAGYWIGDGIKDAEGDETTINNSVGASDNDGLLGDLNGDGIVDVVDLVILDANWTIGP